MPASSSALLDRYLAHVAASLGALEVKRAPAKAVVVGPESWLSLREVPGGYIEISAWVGLHIGKLAWWDDPLEVGSGSMDWWAELSDAAHEWEALGFEIDQPGGFDVSEGQQWVYQSTARKRVRVSESGRRVLVRALKLMPLVLA